MIRDELDVLRTAAEQDDRIAIMESIECFDIVFEQDRLGSQQFDTMAALLDHRNDDSSDDVKDKYREAVIELEQRRIELDRSALAYVQGKESSMALVESVDAVDKAYQVCQKRMIVLETAVSDAITQPLLVLWGNSTLEVPKGATVNAAMTLSVVGRSHPNLIRIDAESEMPATVLPSTVGNLDKNETIMVRVELSPPTAGKFDTFVTAAGKTIADQFRFTTLVLAKGDYVIRAIQAVESLETTLDSMERRRQWNGLRNQVRTLRRRLESISNDLENQRRSTRSMDNRLNAARNAAEAMKREISSSEPSVERQEVLYILKIITDILDNAIESLS